MAYWYCHSTIGCIPSMMPSMNYLIGMQIRKLKLAHNDAKIMNQGGEVW